LMRIRVKGLKDFAGKTQESTRKLVWVIAANFRMYLLKIKC
jgi:hypothetical protein